MGENCQLVELCLLLIYNKLSWTASAESERRGANYSPIINTIPVKRWGNPEEIAEACVFLAGEKASLITGADLVVDGGKKVSTWVD
jgi:NAD(P)-dependent dehydrogenase (short-subunit alcohol dehydrogenase family)